MRVPAKNLADFKRAFDPVSFMVTPDRGLSYGYGLLKNTKTVFYSTMKETYHVKGSIEGIII